MVSRLSVLLFLLPVASAKHALFAGDLDEILAKHYAARGGLDKLASVKAMQFSGSIIKKTNEIAFTYTVGENRCRLDYAYADKKLTRLYDGQKAWQINPLICSEPQPLTRQETRRMRQMADEMTGPLVNWKEKGHRLVYHGLKPILGETLHKISVTKKHGQKEIVYLNPETFLEHVVIRKQQGGQTQFMVFSSFETLDGMTFPKEIVACSELSCCLKETDDLKKCKRSRTIRYDIRTLNPQVKEGFFVVGPQHGGR